MRTSKAGFPVLVLQNRNLRSKKLSEDEEHYYVTASNGFLLYAVTQGPSRRFLVKSVTCKAGDASKELIVAHLIEKSESVGPLVKVNRAEYKGFGFSTMEADPFPEFGGNKKLKMESE